MLSALILDDDPESLAALAALVALEGFQTLRAGTLAEARARLASDLIDVALVDLTLPDGSGFDIVRDLQEHSSAEIVVVTGSASVDSAVEALRVGAADYLTKPVDTTRLRVILSNVARTRDLKREVSTLRGTLRELGRFGPLVGASPAMLALYELIERAAPTEVPVLLIGESGTGKEQVANAIHELSKRRMQSFVAVNCGAIAPGLIESELFGHERGAFTGAVKSRRGYFEQAAGGTLFLDEITEMPIELQVKLLRVLETGTQQRVGGEASIPINVRLVTATNRDPDEAIAQGKLRRDLFFRLNVFPVKLPPLCDREGDVALLADYFLGQLNAAERTRKRFNSEATDRLRTYSWPGNVRELRNVVQRAYIVSDHEIGAQALPREISEPGSRNVDTTSAIGLSLAEVDRRLILATLNRLGGNKKRTAEMLGISLKTLYNRLAEYEREARGQSA
jgi:DNA-binding NtrC family response regulator